MKLSLPGEEEDGDGGQRPGYFLLDASGWLSTGGGTTPTPTTGMFWRTVTDDDENDGTPPPPPSRTPPGRSKSTSSGMFWRTVTNDENDGAPPPPRKPPGRSKSTSSTCSSFCSDTSGDLKEFGTLLSEKEKSALDKRRLRKLRRGTASATADGDVSLSPGTLRQRCNSTSSASSVSTCDSNNTSGDWKEFGTVLSPEEKSTLDDRRQRRLQRHNSGDSLVGCSSTECGIGKWLVGNDEATPSQKSSRAAPGRSKSASSTSSSADGTSKILKITPLRKPPRRCKSSSTTASGGGGDWRKKLNPILSDSEEEKEYKEFGPIILSEQEKSAGTLQSKILQMSLQGHNSFDGIEGYWSNWFENRLKPKTCHHHIVEEKQYEESTQRENLMPPESPRILD